MISTDPMFSSAFRQAETRNADSGFDEQWQRALEKAYFEKQMETMCDDGKGVASTAMALPVTGRTAVVQASPNGLVQNNVYQSDFVNKAISSKEHNLYRQAQSQQIAEKASVAAADSIGVTSNDLSQRAVVQFSALLKKQDSGPVRSFLSQQNSVSWKSANDSPEIFCNTHTRNVLPLPNSVKVLAAERGAHLVIRDSSLEKVDIQRVLMDMRDFFANSGRRLLAITLNGERIWSGHEQPPENTEMELTDLERFETSTRKIDCLF